MKPAFEKLFGFDPKVNNVRTEILAGITTYHGLYPGRES